MFRWYQNAEVCFAYLSDIPAGGLPGIPRDFGESRWFDRGWTLQELIAPKHVIFYNSHWMEIGSKLSLCDAISERTGINKETLRGEDVTQVSVSKRMSWASKRMTTRTEDIAYCLMGIFGVNMPLLYGEGKKAFVRLQEEIMKDSEDQSLFSWTAVEESEPESTVNSQTRGLLAQSPVEFSSSGNFVPVHLPYPSTPYLMTNRGLRIDMPLLPRDQVNTFTGILRCRNGNESGRVSAIDLKLIDGDKFSRINPRVVRKVPVNVLPTASVKTMYVEKEIFTAQDHSFWWNAFQIRTHPPDFQDYVLSDVYPVEHWSPAYQTMHIPDITQSPMAGFLFEREYR